MIRPTMLGVLSVLLLATACATRQDSANGTDAPAVTTHDVKDDACCSRCRTRWGTDDLAAHQHHRDANRLIMDTGCKWCRYHGAYKIIRTRDVPDSGRNDR